MVDQALPSEVSAALQGMASAPPLDEGRDEGEAQESYTSWAASAAWWGAAAAARAAAVLADLSAPVVKRMWSSASEAAEAGTQVMTERAKTFSDFLRDRIKLQARRLALPQSPEARVPPYWRCSDNRLLFVKVKRKREALEKFLLPSGSLGGRDLRYLEPRGYTAFRYAAAWRIENPVLFSKYIAEQESVRETVRRARACDMNPPKAHLRGMLKEATQLLTEQNRANLDEDINEVYLLHGTSPERILQIAEHGFNERLCSNALFGNGTYFAEDIGKADQYVEPDRDYRASRESGEDDSVRDLHRKLYPGGEEDHPQDVFYVIVCRVSLGAFARTTDGRRRLAEADGWDSGPLWPHGVAEGRQARELADIPGVAPPGPFHALVAETGGRVVRYREFVSFHAETRAYPEYLVAYKRVQARLP